MDNYKAQELIDKYESGLCNAEEKAWVESWFIDALNKSEGIAEKLNYKQKETEIWNMLPVAAKAVIKADPTVKIDNTRRLWPRIAIVAAAIAAITLGIWFYASNLIVNHNSQVVTQNDVAPGKNSATITLANGKTISLSDAKTGIVIGSDLKYNDGSAVANLSPSRRDGVARESSNNNNPLSPQGGSLPRGERSKAQMLTASTPRGGTYQITLSDGTHVWLNADSKISFPSQFIGKYRKILLISGEAYFEVAKDKNHPFIVSGNNQQVEVLGTHFNISCYADESSTKTTLLEGSVRIVRIPPANIKAPASGLNADHIILKPNQQLIATEKSFRVQLATNDEIAWKNGLFNFTNENIKTAMRKISRWYNVEVKYEGDLSKNGFGGVISRYKNVSEVLEMLNATREVECKLEGKTIIVSPYKKK